MNCQPPPGFVPPPPLLLRLTSSEQLPGGASLQCSAALQYRCSSFVISLLVSQLKADPPSVPPPIIVLPTPAPLTLAPPVPSSAHLMGLWGTAILVNHMSCHHFIIVTFALHFKAMQCQMKACTPDHDIVQMFPLLVFFILYHLPPLSS